MAKQEAKYAIEAMKKYKSSCPIAYDLEYDSIRYARTKGVEINKSLATAMAKAFLEEVENAGYIPILYTNNDYEKNYFDMDQFNCHIWYARYKDSISTTEKDHASIWQKSSTGKVSGISGNVDINEFYTDFEQSEVVEEDKQKVVCNINILNFQKAANNDEYRDENGNKLVEDGIDGTNTQYVRKQIVLKAKKTDKGYVVGSKGFVAEWWQTRLNEMGFGTGVDGLYGKSSRSDTISMQEMFNLDVDGVAGYNSLSTAFYN
jgi:peptidoglycan hydrolase-like protein with peptidoglycan-binding domain